MAGELIEVYVKSWMNLPIAIELERFDDIAGSSLLETQVLGISGVRDLQGGSVIDSLTPILEQLLDSL